MGAGGAAAARRDSRDSRDSDDGDKPNLYHSNANLDGNNASRTKDFDRANSRTSGVLSTNRGDNGNRKLSHELDLGDDHFEVQADKATQGDTRTRLEKIVFSQTFDAVMGIVVAINAIMMGIEYQMNEEDSSNWEYRLLMLDLFFLTIFTIELAMRLSVLGLKKSL